MVNLYSGVGHFGVSMENGKKLLVFCGEGHGLVDILGH
jgi:hypothetical protein